MKKFILLLMVMVLFIFVGCQPPKEYNLGVVLPSKKGFFWQYAGEGYGHSMRLVGIDYSAKDLIVYYIKGEVDDISEGQSKADNSIELQYLLKDDSIIQKHKGEMMLDLPYQQLILIKKPFEVGSTWRQEVQLIDESEKFELYCEITEIVEEEGIKKYTVVYRHPDRKNYEKRVIADGKGVIKYIRTISIDENQVQEIAYKLL